MQRSSLDMVGWNSYTPNMSRLSEDILSNVDIVDVVSRYVQLKRVGRNFVGLSPFRNEKTPSFTVSPEKQIFKCFSTGI